MLNYHELKRKYYKSPEPIPKEANKYLDVLREKFKSETGFIKAMDEAIDKKLFCKIDYANKETGFIMLTVKFLSGVSDQFSLVEQHKTADDEKGVPVITRSIRNPDVIFSKPKKGK